MSFFRVFRKIFPVVFIFFLWIPAASTADVQDKYLWLEFDKCQPGLDGVVTQDFILRYGEMPSQRQNFDDFPELNAYYYSFKEKSLQPIGFRKVQVRHKNNEAHIVIPYDGFPWYLVYVKGVQIVDGQRRIYTAKTCFLLTQKSAVFSPEKVSITDEIEPYFDYMVFYRRNSEDFFVNRLNWSGISSLIFFRHQPLFYHDVKVYDNAGQGVLCRTNAQGLFMQTPGKIKAVPDNGSGRGGQEYIAVTHRDGVSQYLGTYTVLLEPRRLLLNKIGYHDHIKGLIIFLVSAVFMLMACLFVVKRGL